MQYLKTTNDIQLYIHDMNQVLHCSVDVCMYFY